MTKTIGIALALVLGGGVARAQAMQSCYGSWAGSIGLALDDGGGVSTLLPDPTGAGFFGAAECACGAPDLRLRVDLSTALAAGTVGTVEVWEGPGCLDYASRTQEDHVCRLVANVDITQLTTLGSGSVALPIPTQPLCGSASSGVTIIAYTDPMQPFASCEVRMPIGRQLLPAPPVTTSFARNDDGSVRLGWSASSTSNVSKTVAYQILCADAGGNPIGAATAAADYSICLPNQILERRALISGAAPAGAAIGNFAELDDAYVCSPELDAGTSDYVVGGLVRDREYQLVVVAIDEYGNATPSLVAHAMPLEAPGGSGCSLLGSRTPAPPALLLVLLLGLLRRTMRAWTYCPKARRSTRSIASSATCRRAAWAPSTK